MKKFELPRTPAQWLEAVMNAIFFLCGILAVGCVAVITIYMFLSGLPAIGKIGPLKFLFVTEALGYIPPAAFAALVANDLVSPGAFDAGLWPALVPWVAAAGVVVVAIKTKSMLWCCVSGVVLYIVLSLI